MDHMLKFYDDSALLEGSAYDTTHKCLYFVSLRGISVLLYRTDGITGTDALHSAGTREYSKARDHNGKVYPYHIDASATFHRDIPYSHSPAFSKNGSFPHIIEPPLKKVAEDFYEGTQERSTFDKYITECPRKGSPNGTSKDNGEMLWTAQWGGGKFPIGIQKMKK